MPECVMQFVQTQDYTMIRHLQDTHFQYKLIKKGARTAEFENVIEWLILSGIISQIY